MTAETAAPRKMSWLAIMQVSLLNIAVTVMIVPLDSTLNRIMITELGLSATLVAVLLGLRFLTSPLRIWFGRFSDTHPINGRYRTWYIGLGMVLMVAGFVLTPRAAFAVAAGGVGPILFAIFAFGLLGLGVNMTTPLYFALVSDQSDEQQRPRIVAIMFILLGVAVVVTAGVISVALEPYTDERLFTIFNAIAGLALLLTLLGLVRLEPRRLDRMAEAMKASSEPGVAAVRRLLIENREVARFFFYLLLTFIAVEAQEVILEPYAAEAFGMTPAETTRLTAIFRAGSLVMLAVGAWLVNRIGRQKTAVIGIIITVVGFGLIIAGGASGISGPFMGGVLGIGLGSGAITVANLSLMMDLTDARHAGVFLGVWGFAQAIGVGGGTLLGGILRDLGVLVFGAGLGSYILVYTLEIVLLLVAIPLIRRVSVAQFREASRKLTMVDTLSSAAD